MKKLLVNSITLARLLLVISSMWLLIHGDRFYYIILFCIAIISDFFDGYIARKLDVTSKKGAIFDAITDALSILILFTTLYLMKRLSLLFLIIICLRFFTMLLANFISLIKRKRVLNTSKFGRVAIVVFAILIVIYLITYDSVISRTALGVSIILYFISAIGYLLSIFKDDKK